MSRGFVRALVGATTAVALAGCLQDFNMFLSHNDGGADADAAGDTGPADVTCTAPQTNCGGTCTDMATDPNNCGACGTVCPSMNGTPACGGGQCTLACNMGFTDCDGMPETGCEANTATDPMNCGMCSHACPVPANGTPACRSGACRNACAMGYGDCLTAVQDGCETQLSTDPNHCGMCGHACMATEACLRGTCVAMGSAPDGGTVMPAPEVMTGCAAGTAPGVARECGWTIAGMQTCMPGNVVQVGCAAACMLGSCTGDTIIRVCPGTGPCHAADSIGANDDSPCGSTLCSSTRVICPASGMITVLAQAWDGRAFTCTVGLR